MRPGYGSRHPCIERLIASYEPVARERSSWPNGLDLELTAYFARPDEIDDDLIRSVRCITRVGDGVVFCTTPHDVHIVPGGRREPGETLEQTACREVLEETGWIVDPGSLRQLGLWHIEFLNPELGDPALPRPDIVQIVFTGTATEREGGLEAPWKDTEGWEQSSRVASIGELAGLGVSDAQLAFIPLV